MSARPEFLTNSLIVAAHPDDELLWFQSILRDVDRVVIVYRDFWAQPELGPARAAALADYPRSVECLAIEESGAAGCANWQQPALNEYGMALTIEAGRREIVRLARKSLSVVGQADVAYIPDRSVVQAYKENYDLIGKALEERLEPGMNVFTHNPWGEYGHEEHVQLYRLLCDLRAKIGFRLWMSNYCTERALPLAMQYFRNEPANYVRLKTDKVFADRIVDLYRAHGCWTWTDEWAWFEDECFIEAPDAPSDGGSHRQLVPLNFFSIDS